MRLEDLDVENLSAAQKTVYEAIQQSPRAARHPAPGLIGPFGVWVRAPQIGRAAQALGVAVRFDATLANDVKEVAICTVGAYYRSKFEFAAHRKLAIAAGVDEAKLEKLRLGADPGFANDQNLTYRIARQLLETHRIEPSLYAKAVQIFGEEALIELVTTIGYYCLISLTLNAFEIPLLKNMTDPFPE